MLAIYAAEPWTPESSAIFAWFPDDLDEPHQVGGMTYLIHVAEMEGLMDSWSEKQKPSPGEQCERLIQYVINDA